jgi:hypothetical protein
MGGMASTGGMMATTGGMMAGTGGMPGGMPAGGTPACEPTAPLAEGAVGEHGPSMRINSLAIPNTAAKSAELGCTIVDGSNQGVGLSGLLTILMLDIGTLVTPDPENDGEIQLILLGSLDGWKAGETGDDAENVSMVLYTGEKDGDDFQIGLDSFVDGSAENEPKIKFDADLSCGRVETNQGTFEFGVPVLDTGLTLGLTLSATTVLGSLRAEANGFSVQKGSINGYLTEGSILELLEGVKAACDSADPPEFCAQAGRFLMGDAATIARTIVLPALRGLDSKVNDDGTVEGNCIDNTDCNAVSVCLAFESIGTTITGISN